MKAVIADEESSFTRTLDQGEWVQASTVNRGCTVLSGLKECSYYRVVLQLQGGITGWHGLLF